LGGWFQAIEWTCSIEDIEDPCTGSGPDDYFAGSWTPSEPLNNGEYVWGIAASENQYENSFTGETISRSDTFHFTVDNRLVGHSCVTVTDEYDLEDYLRYGPTPTTTSTPTRTPTATNTPTRTNTSTPDYPTITLDQNYLCNEGPGKNYTPVTSFQRGTTLEVIGTNGNGWWEVRVRGQKVPSCWIGGGHFIGDISDVPVVAQPPPPESSDLGTGDVQITLV
jgi:hypothetical protein